MGRKGPLEEKYELLAYKRSRYDELLTSRLHCELRAADCPCPLHAAGSMKCRFWQQKCVIEILIKVPKVSLVLTLSSVKYNFSSLWCGVSIYGLPRLALGEGVKGTVAVCCQQTATIAFWL